MLADGVLTTGTDFSGGTVEAEEKDVNFIDYDGTILYSYTKAEFANLAALPANPSHTGLTAQGWNWTKQEITAQLTAMPDQKVWVGQMYVTSSGKTEIDIELDDAGLLSPYLKIAVNGTVIINWGDGSTADTVIGTLTLTPLPPTAHRKRRQRACHRHTWRIVAGRSFRFQKQQKRHGRLCKGREKDDRTKAVSVLRGRSVFENR